MKFFSYILIYRQLLLIVFTPLLLLPLPIVLHTKVSEPEKQVDAFLIYFCTALPCGSRFNFTLAEWQAFFCFL